MDCYITNIHIDKLRHIKDIDIKLSSEKRQHLLITGKNGSGKTSLLDALFLELQTLDNHLESTVTSTFSTGRYINPNTLVSYFKANRHLTVDIPKGVEKIVISNNSMEYSRILVKYLVDLKTQQSYAKNEDDFQVADNIQSWFNTFEGVLRKIFESDELKLKYDYKNYNFSIVIPNREPFGFNEISDGYSALVMILAELIIKMDNNQAIDTNEHLYQQEGIVLIDELETHLHVELQKKILPLLVNFFPNIQFVVTTHSPFILNSIENSVIYDLENHKQVEDLSNYSYEAVIETYFNVSKYSNDIKNKFERYKELISKANVTPNERIERATLRNELENISSDYAPDIKVAFTELENKRLSNG